MASLVRPSDSTSHAVCDSASLRAFGGRKTGPNPLDRRKTCSNHDLITDAHGVHLACLLTGATRHDVTQLLRSSRSTRARQAWPL
jgi:hypothetical protein